MFHDHSKHIDIKFHYSRDLVKDSEIAVEFCKSEEEVADILTKPLNIYRSFSEIEEEIECLLY